MECCVFLEFSLCVFKNAECEDAVAADVCFPLPLGKGFLFLIYYFCLDWQVFWTPLPWQVKTDGSSSSLSVCSQKFGSVSAK